MKTHHVLKTSVLVLGSLIAVAAFSPNAHAATIQMYRLYNPNSGEHFYTQNAVERDKVKRAGWRYEGVGWKAPTGGSPVYRMYNPNAGDHFYTLNSYERDNLKSKGWRYEGIGWYSDTKKAVPLYRAYNPNAPVGTHNYTVNYNEEKNLIAHGWRNEGIAWYGANDTPTPTPPKPTPANKTALQNLYNKVKGTGRSDYTASSWNAFQSALNNAKNVLNNGKATQAQVNSAYNALNNAFNNLAHETKYYTVTVKHVDRQKNNVISSETAKVKAGDTYTAKAKPFSYQDGQDDSQNFSYQVNGNSTQSQKINGNSTLTFTYDEVHQVYVYRYDDFSGKSFINNQFNRDVVNVVHGQSATITAQDQQGYVIDPRKGAGKNSVTLSNVTSDQDVNFAYTHQYNVAIKHVDADTGQEIAPTENHLVFEGDSLTGHWKDLSANNYFVCDNYDNAVELNLSDGSRTINNIASDHPITFQYKHMSLAELNNQVRTKELQLLNAYRQTKGAGILQVNPIVQQAADIRSIDLQTKFDHHRPNGGNFQDVLESLGCYGGRGENLSGGQSYIDRILNEKGSGSASDIIETWKSDQGHDGILTDPVDTLAGFSSSYLQQPDGTLRTFNVFIGAENSFK